MRIYLDVCCLNRPLDDQGRDRIRLESEAVIMLLSRVQSGQDEMLSSEIIELENARNSDPRRRGWIDRILRLARSRVHVGRKERTRARQLTALGFGAYDSLHIACAESGKADALLTTDDRLLHRSASIRTDLSVSVANPVQWMAEIRK